ncbi:MAG: porin [Cytophagaceae bacterium]
MRILYVLVFVQVLFLNTNSLHAQEIPDWRARVNLSDSGYVDFLQYFQVWNVVTLQSAESESTPRLDTYIRRARFGLGGQLNSKALFYVGFTYDGIGKDGLSASAGIPNPNDNHTFSIRDAFFTYKFHKLLNLSLGYFRPRAGKESIYTSAFNISQEKGQPSFYPRVHMVGRAIGRETGINLGGFKRGNSHSFLYDVGMFDTNHPLIRGDNSIWSPLLTARGVWMIGDPEFASYQMVYSQSGFMQRKGLSIGANVTYQSKTSLFRNNMVYGMDAQLNYGPLDLLGEYLWLYRETLNLGSYGATKDNSYVIKSAWNIALPKSQILQLSLMHTATRPDRLFKDDALNPLTNANLHEEWAAGVNWLIKRNRLKLGLHYVDGKRQFGNLENSTVGNFKYVNPSIQWMM